MRCLITGVAGFVGSSLADRLLSLGHEVVGMDCFIDYYPRKIKESNLLRAKDYNAFTFIEKNMFDLDLERCLVGVDWVFHQAAQAGVRGSWGAEFSLYTDCNILATQHLLEAAKKERVRETLKKIVYASSSSVYGDAESYPTSELDLPKPVSPYGVTKLAAEHLMVLYTKAYSVPTISLRYFTVYGPRQRPDMAFHKFIRKSLREEHIEVYGDGEQSRDFTFIDDIVTANLWAAEKATTGLVFNIGGGSRVTLNQVIADLEEILGKPLKVNYLPRQMGDAKHTAADISQARDELGYQPMCSLQDGLRKEVYWLEENMHSW